MKLFVLLANKKIYKGFKKIYGKSINSLDGLFITLWF